MLSAVCGADVSASTIEHGFHRPEGHDQLIMDGPCLLLLPCLLLWPFFEAAVGYGFIHNALGKALPLDIALLTVFPLLYCIASENASGWVTTCGRTWREVLRTLPLYVPNELAVLQGIVQALPNL